MTRTKTRSCSRWRRPRLRKGDDGYPSTSCTSPCFSAPLVSRQIFSLVIISYPTIVRPPFKRSKSASGAVSQRRTSERVGGVGGEWEALKGFRHVHR